jgi:hypothetical protein
MILGSLKYITAETLWSEPRAFKVEMAIQRYKSVGTGQIPSEFIFHILEYLKTRLIQYFCTQSGKLAHVQPRESAVLCQLWLLYCCIVSLAWCFVFVDIKKVIWCNLSAELFEELDPVEQRVGAGRAWASYSANQEKSPKMPKIKKYRC